MFVKKNSSKNGSCHPAVLLHIIAAIALSFVLIVAAADLVLAHSLGTSLLFGTSGASLSVIAFIFTLTMLIKHVKACMGGCCGGECCGK